MTKIQKVVGDIENLQDFYKRTKLLRARIKKKGLGRKKIEQQDSSGTKSRRDFTPIWQLRSYTNATVQSGKLAPKTVASP